MKILVIGGFLGSGKTTVLMQLAKYITALPESPRVVILENEIGEVGVDNRVLGGSAFSVENVFSGCICCSGAVDLVEAVTKIREEFNPEWLLIEATGMALPSAIRETLSMSMELSSATLTIADASRWSRIIKVSPDFAGAQIEGADFVLMTKTDKAGQNAESAFSDIKARGRAKVLGICALEPIDAAVFEEITAKAPENN